MSGAYTFTALGLSLPLGYEGDGQIVDAADRPVCVVDPYCESSDGNTDEIAKLIVRACNFYEVKAGEARKPRE